MLEVWGGIECTLNRVGDRIFDQIQRSGHAERLDDLDRIAALGVRTLRYPVLWERASPNGVANVQWHWSDARLGRLRTLGVEPIVGLLHHGSGPLGTSLLDPEFPEALARYARAVAGRYGWVTRYTPINEPLTTARFSALYGHWYPHTRDDAHFARALVNQIRAIALAMRAIRTVVPDASLIQTEDLGKTYATPAMQGQASFENERRWLTFDLLAGRLDRSGPMWEFLRLAGIPDWELQRLRDEPCPPEVSGINYYLTSERFLDERVDRYPPASHGGNGRQEYADVEAVRVCANGIGGHRAMLTEAWNRYHTPLALTEVHAGATREQQMRWLAEAWGAAHDLRAHGVAIRAITAWALFGSYDWHNLLTREDGRYEPGAFDVRGPSPRRTALGAMVHDLAHTGRHAHAVLAGPGWWRRGRRLLYDEAELARHSVDGAWLGDEREPRRPLLLAGANGTLGQAFATLCAERGLDYRQCSRRTLDIADPAQVDELLDAVRPWAIVNAAGYVRVDDAEREGEACARENTHGPAVLARACARRGVALLTFSTDLVFDGSSARPYLESDTTGPLGMYGRSKRDAERVVLELLPSALVVRTSAFFGPWDDHNFITQLLLTLAADQPFAAGDDQVVSPTYVPHLVHASLDLLIDGASGVWHLANDGAVTWAEFARRAAERAGFDAGLVTPRSARDLGLVARRPRYSALGTERGQQLPTLEEGLASYMATRAPRHTAREALESIQK